MSEGFHPPTSPTDFGLVSTHNYVGQFIEIYLYLSVYPSYSSISLVET